MFARDLEASYQIPVLDDEKGLFKQSNDSSGSVQ